MAELTAFWLELDSAVPVAVGKDEAVARAVPVGCAGRCGVGPES